MKNVKIFKIDSKHIEELQEIGRKTFAETFSESNSEEDMRKYLEESFAKEKLIEEIQNPNTAFYFATWNEKVIGYLKLNFSEMQTEIKDNQAIEIERIYVLKEFHGKKIGQILYQKAFEIAQQHLVKYIWLGVWEKNEKAIQFYKKNGFEAFEQHIFQLGNDEQIDILMRRFLE